MTRAEIADTIVDLKAIQTAMKTHCYQYDDCIVDGCPLYASGSSCIFDIISTIDVPPFTEYPQLFGESEKKN